MVQRAGVQDKFTHVLAWQVEWAAVRSSRKEPVHVQIVLSGIPSA